MSLAYFYRRYGGSCNEMYMTICWGATNLAELMDAGEDQDSDIPLDVFSRMEVVPLVSGESFSVCVGKMEALLKRAYESGTISLMDNLFEGVRKNITEGRFNGLNRALDQQCMQYKQQLDATPAKES